MKQRTGISSELPPVFLQKMAGLLGDEAAQFFSSLQQPPLMGLRVNTLKISVADFSAISQFGLLPVPWCQSGFMVESAAREVDSLPPGRHPYHHAGLYYLQEPSAMLAAQALSPLPGETVLDLAAAPGGKSTHLAGLMQNRGLLVANEIHPSRVWDLVENLERCGVTNAIVTNETPDRLAKQWAELFDRVMLDAPCSGEGMFRKSEKARIEWKPEFPLSCAMRQSAILNQAARMVKPGGSLAYTTCTFSPEENEAVIHRFLTAHPEFDIRVIEPISGFQPARPGWIGLPDDHCLSRAVRLWPHLSPGEGHFVAILTKNSTDQKEKHLTLAGPRPAYRDKRLLMKDEHQVRTVWMDFAARNFAHPVDEEEIILHGLRLYRIPESAPALGRLKVIHPGWWLGTIRTGRLIPSHALAMGCHEKQVNRVIALKTGDRQVAAYLAGESFTHVGEDGWALVTIDGFPIGWGKRVQGVVKNYYPRGLRRYA